MKKLYFILREKLLINALTHLIPGMVKPFVLCYHQIDTDEFEAQILSLRRRFNIVDLDTFIGQLAKGQSNGYCTITLDDCLKKDVEKAIKVCRKYQVPITFFLPVKFSLENKALPGTKVQRFLEEKKAFRFQGTEYVVNSKNRDVLKEKVFSFFHPARFKIEAYDAAVKSWFLENEINEADIIRDLDKVIGIEEVKKLSGESVSNFQSHTYSHESLGLCTQDEIEFELKESKQVLQRVTGKPVNALCYPYGSKEVIGEKVLHMIPACYSCAFTLLQGVCNRQTSRYFIPRIGIYPGDSLDAFWGKIYHNMQMSFFK